MSSVIFEDITSSNYITILNITGISPISQGIVGTDHRGFLDVIDLSAPAAAVTGLRTTLADSAAADPVLGIEDDHALIAVIFAVQSEEGDLVCRHFREGEELLRRNEQVKVAGGDGRRRIGVGALN